MTTFAISGSSSAQFVQSSDIGQLEEQLSAALQQLSAQSLLVTSLSLAGAGDGSNFGVLIEAATEESITGGTGISPDELSPKLYVASTPEELLKQRAAAVLASPPAGFPFVVDTQVAGTTKGTRFAGMALFAVSAVNPIDTPIKELSEPNWWVNSVTGDDTNDGLTAETALLTVDELVLRRFGPSPRFITNTMLHLIEEFDTTDMILLGSADDGVSVAIVGQAKVSREGALTGVTNYASGTNTALITDSGVSDWSGDVGDRLTLTSGTNAGAMNWVAKDLGGGQARTNTWFTLAPIGAGAGNVVTAFGLNASIGDDYRVETFNSIRSMFINIARPGGSLNPLNAVDIRDLAVGGYVRDSDYQSVLGVHTTIAGCVVSAVLRDSDDLVLAGCRGQDVLPVFTRNMYFDSCLFLGSLFMNGVSGGFFRKQTLFQGTAPFMVNTSHGSAQEIAVFDSSAAFNCARNSFFTIGGLIFGVGTASSAFVVNVDATLAYLVLPTLVSGGDDVDLGPGTPFDYDDLPQVVAIKKSGMIT